MGKLKVVTLIKGESVIGELMETNGNMVKLKERDGDTIARVTVTESVVDTIEEECSEGDIIEIKRNGSDFEIFTHDEFPEEKEKGK